PPPTPATGPYSTDWRGLLTPSSPAWPRPPITSTASPPGIAPPERGRGDAAPTHHSPDVQAGWKSNFGWPPPIARLAQGGRMLELTTAPVPDPRPPRLADERAPDKASPDELPLSATQNVRGSQDHERRAALGVRRPIRQRAPCAARQHRPRHL